MPNISRKGALMPESPIRKLVPYAESAKKSGKEVFHLNIGQPDILSPKIALKTIKSFNGNLIEYSHSAGFETYRKGLAMYYQKMDINIEYTDLMVTTGGSEALQFALNSCLDPGDEIIVPEPFYANYNGFSVASGVKIKPITTTIENGFALPSIDDFERLITSNTKAILICNPGNPTGYLYSLEELNVLKDIVVKHNLFLIADEVYREFVYDGESHHSILNLEGLDKHAIMIDSTSKRYSMCGIRIGCIVSRNQEVISTALKFAQARLSPPTFGQIAAEAALNTPEEYFVRAKSEYLLRRNLLIEGLNSIDGIICPKPKGAFYAMAELPVDNADDFSQWLLQDFHYKGSTVMVAPAAGFYSSPNTGMNQVRIAYVLNEESLLKSIECLSKALKLYKN
tara:strand:+ start:190 stop:1380 length:1191 start_codon:yes stop_codon:yes gene_type:complete